MNDSMLVSMKLFPTFAESKRSSEWSAKVNWIVICVLLNRFVSLVLSWYCKIESIVLSFVFQKLFLLVIFLFEIVEGISTYFAWMINLTVRNILIRYKYEHKLVLINGLMMTRANGGGTWICHFSLSTFVKTFHNLGSSILVSHFCSYYFDNRA